MAICDSCGRPLCLRCAVPVRGQVFGPECLPTVLGSEGATLPHAVPAPPRDVRLVVVAAGFVVALIGTVLSWTRFGVGSGTFGGWGISPLRWSTVASPAALLGAVIAVILVARRRDPGTFASVALLVLGSAAVVGAALHSVNPPPFTQAWLGPWVTLGGAAVATGASAALLVKRRRVP